jgi:hypothetical protein
MGHVEGETSFFHDPASISSFCLALGRQGHVVPASKEVQLVPRTLAVAEENKISEHVDIVGDRPNSKNSAIYKS